MPIRRAALALLAALAAIMLPKAPQAHHGVVWVEERPVTVEGVVVKEMTGFPHFEIRVQEGDTRWTIDLGNDFRLKRAGLQPDGSDMPVGKTIRVQGFPASEESLKLIRARTIWIGDREHILFQEDERHY